MGISPDLSTVLEPSPLLVERKRSRLIARTLSGVFSPPLTCLAIILYVAILTSPRPAAWRVSMYILICIILPVIYLLKKLKCGEITDFHMIVRSQRVKPMAAMMGSTTAGWLFLLLTRRQYDILTVIAGVALIQYALMLGVTLFWKVSAHTMAATGLAILLTATQGPYALSFLALIPLMIWARVILRRHTLGQALAGSVMGAASALTILYLVSGECLLRGLICLPG